MNNMGDNERGLRFLFFSIGRVFMKNLNFAVLFILLAVLAFPSAGNASTIYTLISTGQSGANTTVDSTHDSLFYAPSLNSTALCPSGVSCASYGITYFDATFNWLLGGGNFVIKTNGNASADIILNLYDVTGVSTLPSTPVATASVPYTSVSNSYTQTPILFSTPYEMTAGRRYAVVLTSSTGVNGSAQFFIKTPSDAVVVDSNGNPPTPENPVPEPSPFIMAACGLGLISFNFFLRPVLKKR
jgi:hypothetical protein